MTSFTPDWQMVGTEVAEAISHSPHIERLLQTLCREIGPRPAGTKAIAEARALLSTEWRGFGMANVHTEDVPLTAWDEGACSLEITAPEQRKVACVQCINSASGTVEGRVVDGGKLDLADLLRLGEKLVGSIVLVKGFDFTGGKFEPLQKRISVAQAAGAAAILLIGSHPDLPAIFFISRLQIPILNISAGAGKELIELSTGTEVSVRLQASGHAYPATCANLMGELGPGDPPRDIIITCAHLDGFFNSPGAIDDLTGIVAITEIARALAPYGQHLPRTLRVVAFTGEELGYAGSKSYVRTHADELDRTRFILSQDCLYENTAKGMSVIWSPEMRDFIAGKLDTAHPGVDVRNHFAMSSDYLPFMLQGVPAGKPSDWFSTFPSWTHTVIDTDDNVPLEWIRTNAVMCAHTLLTLLTAPEELPGRRNSRDEIFKLIEQEDVEECLRWQIGLP